MESRIRRWQEGALGGVSCPCDRLSDQKTLMITYEFGSTGVVRTLLDDRANINATTNGHKTTLSYFVRILRTIFLDTAGRGVGFQEDHKNNRVEIFATLAKSGAVGAKEAIEILETEDLGKCVSKAIKDKIAKLKWSELRKAWVAVALPLVAPVARGIYNGSGGHLSLEMPPRN